MTIDTSREAVERLNTHRVYIDRTMCFDEGITWTTVAGLYPHAYVPEDFALALLARAEAAEAEREDMATLWQQAEMGLASALAERDAALAEVVRLQERLSAEMALYASSSADRDAERKLADDLARAFRATLEALGPDAVRSNALAAHAARRNEETLAKHGSKT